VAGGHEGALETAIRNPARLISSRVRAALTSG
jgi:hypothetical protein